jgi:hypothetical protein
LLGSNLIYRHDHYWVIVRRSLLRRTICTERRLRARRFAEITWRRQHDARLVARLDHPIGRATARGSFLLFPTHHSLPDHLACLTALSLLTQPCESFSQPVYPVTPARLRRNGCPPLLPEEKVSRGTHLCRPRIYILVSYRSFISSYSIHERRPRAQCECTKLIAVIV